MKVKPRIALGLCHVDDKREGNLVSDLSMASWSTWARCSNGFIPAEENSDSVYRKENLSTTKMSKLGSSGSHHLSSEMQNKEGQKNKLRTDGVLDQGLLSCITCGIVSYACVAVIQPREAAAGYLMSANCTSFSNQIVGFEDSCGLNNEATRKTLNSDDINRGNIEKIHSSVQVPFSNDGLLSDAKVKRGASALDLLASAYGDLSDSEEDALHDVSFCADGNTLTHAPLMLNLDQQSMSPITSECISHNGLSSKEGEAFFKTNYQNRATGTCDSLSKLVHSSEAVSKSSYASKLYQFHENDSYESVCEEKMGHLYGNREDTVEKPVPSKMTTFSLSESVGDLQSPKAWIDPGSTYGTDPTTINLNDMMIKKLEPDSSGFYSPDSFYDSTITTGNTASTIFSNMDDSIKNSSMAVLQKSNKESSRMHIFCLEHAVEVEKRLRTLGGVNLMLLCHPEYPKIESDAKLLAEEMGLNHQWKDVPYRDASEQDQEKIRIAIEDEEVIPCNGDWAVKLGINLYHSVKLSQSPLFRKQLPYNEVIYKSFSQKSPAEQNSSGRIARRQKKIIFAGKWCGKVWMSNQVHPYLADQNLSEDGDEIDLSLESDSCRENGNQVTLPRRNSSNNNTVTRRKSCKKRTKSSTRRPAYARLDNPSDARYAEENSGYAGNADSDPDTDKSEADTDIEDDKHVILPRRISTNNNAAARKKSDKKKKSAVRSSTRRPAYTRLDNSSDARFAVEDSGYTGNGDGDPDTARSEADTDMEDDKQAILPRRNSTNNKAASRRKSQKKKKKSGVRSSTLKSAHARLDNSSNPRYAKAKSMDAGNADGDPDTDRSETDPNINDDKQAILQTMNPKNNNAAARRKSDNKKKSSAVRSSTRKPAHTRLEDSSDAGSAEENSGNAGYDDDDDQDRDQSFQSSEADTDSSNKNQAILSRSNLPNNNAAARMKSGRKRKRSKVSGTRKAARTRPDSFAKAGYAEDDLLIKCGRSLSCLRSSLKGTNQEPPSMRLRKRRLNSGEAIVVVAPEKHKNTRKIKKTPDSAPDKEDFPCDVDGCSMCFRTKHDLALHKRNVCPEKGCGKKFFSHKYLLQHRKVHSDDRPLKCPWKGCKMTFKWAWARTEHIRVHTGERPYLCRELGCDLTFRFVSDFSRHRRKTGH